MAGISASRCEELFREICVSGEFPDVIRLEFVFRRWLELEDPKQLLARLAAEKQIQQRTWTGPFFEAWAAMDYKGAIAGTADNGGFSEVRTLVALRRRDPSILSESLQIGDPDKSAVAKALALLGRNDPELARNVATGKGKPDNNADLINVVAGGWATQGPQAALDWVKSLDLSADNRLKAFNKIFAEWLKLDLAAATEAFKSSDLASEVNRGKLDESLEVLRAPETARSQIFNGVHLDPFLDLAGLYQKISATAIDWDQRQSVNPPIDHDGWFCTDPARTAEEASRLPPGKARDFIMGYICGQWADQNPEEATTFAKLHGLPPPYVREEPSAEMVHAALAAPEETFANLVSPGQEPMDANLAKLAEKWAAADPQTAAEWLIARMDVADDATAAKTAQSSMYQNFLGYYWAKVDAAGASEWLENLPAGPRKTEACLAMADGIQTYSPDLAFTVSANILEGETKMRMLGSAIQKVAEKIGPPAARELLGNSGLTADEQATLGKVIDGMKPPAR
ncbi:MAG: hypothetical protein ABIS50_19690 [Luteolibacter sp.]|uniref:hypothetical protein n=1 Tax=Luteolibacter sp. TaxID=1962973 RepID=UPI003267B4FD